MKAMRTKTTEIHSLRCTVCGTVMPIPRRKNMKRSEMHVKHMYCPVCKRETSHVEYSGSWQVK